MSEAIQTTYSRRKDIPAEQVMAFREESGLPLLDTVSWEFKLREALEVVSAWESSRLIGIVFLAGSIHHAYASDLAVIPDKRAHGIGREIMTATIAIAAKEHIQKIALDYEDEPWLKDFYMRLGFKLLGSGMLLTLDD